MPLTEDHRRPEIDPDLVTLAAQLRSADGRRRQQARADLVHVGRRAVPSMLAVLRDPDWKLRIQAVQILADIGDPRALQPLCEAISDWDWEVRKQAAAALVRMGDASAVPALCAALGDGHPQVRLRSAEALGRIAAALPRMQRAREKAHRRALLEGLGADEPVEEPREIEALREMVLPLCHALEDAELGVREQAAAALVNSADTRAQPYLCAALEDQGDTVREAAAAALVRVADRQAAAPLIRALDDPLKRVRLHAAAGLARIARRDAGAELRGALPALRRRLRFWALEDEECARAYRKALERIEAATEHLRDVPLPAGGPTGASPAVLPLPVTGGDEHSRP